MNGLELLKTLQTMTVQQLQQMQVQPEACGIANGVSEVPVQYVKTTASDDVVSTALEYIETMGVVKYSNTQVDSVAAARNYLRLKLHDQRVEQCWVIFLDNSNRIIDCILHAEGTINTCSVYIREIVRHVLLIDAKCVILAHNHPSGALTPSNEDFKLTERIAKALDVVDCTLLDHFIVAKGVYYSFAEHDDL